MLQINGNPRGIFTPLFLFPTWIAMIQPSKTGTIDPIHIADTTLKICRNVI